jgi:release factor glutamine methyltransferase
LHALTVLEGIKRSAEFLAKKGVESPRLEAELLLAHILGLKRMQLYLSFERELTEAETNAYREGILRRSQREPLQHIIGSASFCGFEIKVNKTVLVPRPETELLAETGWKFLTQISAGADAGPLALDFGTGSGCLPIALARHCPNVKIHATDISSDSLEQAAANASINGVSDRIEFHQGDGFAAIPSDLRFDLIISNPPYIPTAEIATLEPEVRDFDPHQALDGGADGLNFYRRLATQAAALLKAGGKMMFEFGDGQAESIRKILETENWVVEAIVEDYTRRPRIMVAKRS